MTILLRYLGPMAAIAALGGGLFFFVPSPSPPSAGELAELAIGYVKANRPAEARPLFDKAMALDPQNFRAHYGAGVFAFRDNRFDDAITYFKQALAIKPHDEDSLLTLGAAYHRLHRFPEAMAIYKDLLERDPHNSKVVYNIGMLQIDRMNYPAAKAALQEYLRLEPNNPERYDVEARIHNIDRAMRLDGMKTK